MNNMESIKFLKKELNNICMKPVYVIPDFSKPFWIIIKDISSNGVISLANNYYSFENHSFYKKSF